MSTAAVAKLLIVDDEAALMTALCNTLQLEDYATTGFTSATEAGNGWHRFSAGRPEHRS
jgi:DNA-binding NtrC family response regulator